MSWIDYLKSKVFFKQLVLAVLGLIIATFLFLKFLGFRTNHGEEIAVPDLSKMQVQIAVEKLDELDLELIVLDTVDFRQNMPPYSIVIQDPAPNSMVKDGRKIYVKVNAGEYDDVILPALKDKTFRQVSANIKSLGLIEGEITYKPHIAKDIVLGVSQNGRVLKKGDKVKKNSALDFVLGDGKELYNEEEFEKSNDEKAVGNQTSVQ